MNLPTNATALVPVYVKGLGSFREGLGAQLEQWVTPTTLLVLCFLNASNTTYLGP